MFCVRMFCESIPESVSRPCKVKLVLIFKFSSTAYISYDFSRLGITILELYILTDINSKSPFVLHSKKASHTF